MSAGESTPAPASVEQAARQAALDHADEHRNGSEVEWSGAQDDYRLGYLRGWQDAASADRAALARANELLGRAVGYLGDDAPGLRAEIKRHLGLPGEQGA